jgi:hypothetical protein
LRARRISGPCRCRVVGYMVNDHANI